MFIKDSKFIAYGFDNVDYLKNLITVSTLNFCVLINVHLEHVHDV